MTDEHTTPTPGEPPATDTIPHLTDELAAALRIPGQDPALLARQAEILDQLFITLVGRKVFDRLDNRYPENPQTWLHFALRVQKQCTDTVKARAAIEYMQSLSTPPPPSQNRQTN